MEPFEIGDLVIDNDTDIVGIITKIYKTEPIPLPLSDKTITGYSYKVWLCNKNDTTMTHTQYQLTKLNS